MKNFTIATLLVGLVSFGGGKAFIPVYERLYVQEYKIINHQQLQEYVGYAVAFPGAISPMLTGLVGFINFGILGFILGFYS